MKKIFYVILLVFTAFPVFAQQLAYPYPVQYINLAVENQLLKMGYMDVKPLAAAKGTVLLLHGKNFNGYYWKDVIAFLSVNGYRVIVPDQLGFGKSDKPNIHYSFSLLAKNTVKLLDTLGIQQTIVIGHSMGGMLATRFTLQYPERVQKLIYENPIGLEDYRTFVPYKTIDEQFAQEKKSDLNSLRKYQQSYYPEWKPEYEQYVQAQYEAMQIPDFETAALASALTSEMIYQQPVVYEFKNITTPTLIIIGQLDRTIVGKTLLSKEVADKHGQYPQLGKMLQQQIRNSRLIELPGVGHIPHIQTLNDFKKAVLDFLR